MVSPLRIASARLRASPPARAFENAADAAREAGRKLLPRRSGAPHVLLYPGQFDPFHVDHLRELLWSADGFDKAVVLPTAGAPGAPRSAAAPGWLKVLIAQTTIGPGRQIQVDDMALRLGIHTAPALVRAMQRRYPADTRFTLLIGSDNYLGIAQWKDAPTMLDSIDLLVNERPGYPVQDRLACLPPEIRASYREEGPDRLRSVRTGRTVEFRRTTATQGFSSHEVIRALRGIGSHTASELLAPAAEELARRYYYPEIDLEEDEHRFQFRRMLGRLLLETLGAQAGASLAADSRLLEMLRAIAPDDEEAVALAAGEVLAAPRRSAGGLESIPRAYSLGVRLARDPRFIEALGEHSSASRKARRPPTGAEQALGRMGDRWNVAVYRRVKPWESRVTEAASRLAQLAPGQGGGHAARAGPPAPDGALGRLRVYVGVRASADRARIREEGLTPKLARKLGEAAVEQRLRENGVTAEVRNQVIGDARNGAFVSASLSPRVARAYAGPGGHLVVADVPTQELFFTNDPALWAGTALCHSGNPEHYLHEVVTRRIRPETIHEVRPVTGHEPSMGTPLGAYARSRLSIFSAPGERLLSALSPRPTGT